MLRPGLASDALFGFRPCLTILELPDRPDHQPKQNNANNGRNWDNKGSARFAEARPLVVSTNAGVSVVLASFL